MAGVLAETWRLVVVGYGLGYLARALTTCAPPYFDRLALLSRLLNTYARLGVVRHTALVELGVVFAAILLAVHWTIALVVDVSAIVGTETSTFDHRMLHLVLPMDAVLVPPLHAFRTPENAAYVLVACLAYGTVLVWAPPYPGLAALPWIVRLAVVAVGVTGACGAHNVRVSMRR